MPKRRKNFKNFDFGGKAMVVWPNRNAVDRSRKIAAAKLASQNRRRAAERKAAERCVEVFK